MVRNVSRCIKNMGIKPCKSLEIKKPAQKERALNKDIV
ncbi:Uncharacterized protein dnl_60860 [Desulfonema limicola]|uniref:Uncharacterized protein n=1 Tax=Desulfonema limicola TaxID=45656 RepID=A0A975BE21_9BACT|nr:Uncharacterized protein dnl_60860 [Desulfonema limicola]